MTWISEYEDMYDDHASEETSVIQINFSDLMGEQA